MSIECHVHEWLKIFMSVRRVGMAVEQTVP